MWLFGLFVPPFRSWLKYLKNNEIDCSVIDVPQRMNPNYFGDLLTCSQWPSIGWLLDSRVKCVSTIDISNTRYPFLIPDTHSHQPHLYSLISGNLQMYWYCHHEHFSKLILALSTLNFMLNMINTVWKTPTDFAERALADVFNSLNYLENYLAQHLYKSCVWPILDSAVGVSRVVNELEVT